MHSRALPTGMGATGSDGYEFICLFILVAMVLTYIQSMRPGCEPCSTASRVHENGVDGLHCSSYCYRGRHKFIMLILHAGTNLINSTGHSAC